MWRRWWEGRAAGRCPDDGRSRQRVFGGGGSYNMLVVSDVDGVRMLRKGVRTQVPYDGDGRCGRHAG